jgi:hypothetical protein
MGILKWRPGSVVTRRGKEEEDSDVNARYYLTAKPNWTLNKCQVRGVWQYTLYRGAVKIGRWDNSQAAKDEADRLTQVEHKEAA